MSYKQAGGDGWNRRALQRLVCEWKGGEFRVIAVKKESRVLQMKLGTFGPFGTLVNFHEPLGPHLYKLPGNNNPKERMIHVKARLGGGGNEAAFFDLGEGTRGRDSDRIMTSNELLAESDTYLGRETILEKGI